MAYLKFNVDGSSSGNPRRAGYGGILKGDTELHWKYLLSLNGKIIEIWLLRRTQW
ncbi:hypothetical protein V6Z12_D06G061500 [Gossypium hirsutum]